VYDGSIWKKARGGGRHDLADVRPIDLGVLADQRLDAQERLALENRAHGSDVLAQRANTARITALFNHLEQPRGAQLWVSRQCLGDEVHLRRAQLAASEVRPPLPEKSPTTRRTTSACTESCLLIVRTGQRSAKCSRRISAASLCLHRHRKRSANAALSPAAAHESAPHPAARASAGCAPQHPDRSLNHAIAAALSCEVAGPPGSHRGPRGTRALRIPRWTALWWGTKWVGMIHAIQNACACEGEIRDKTSCRC
jgi:hypothetical protein